MPLYNNIIILHFGFRLIFDNIIDINNLNYDKHIQVPKTQINYGNIQKILKNYIGGQIFTVIIMKILIIYLMQYYF